MGSLFKIISNVCSPRHLMVATRLMLLGLLCYAALPTFAADSTAVKSILKKPDYFIDDDQTRLDKLDGDADGIIDLGDSATTAYATKVYLTMVDSLQRLLYNPKFEESKRRAIREAVYYKLHSINRFNIYNIKRYENIFKYLIGQLNATAQNRLCSFLISNNLIQAFSTFALFKNEPCADSFLLYAARYRPDLVFMKHEFYHNKDYALNVLETATKAAPVTAKRYFNLKDPIYEALKKSNDTAVKVILEIKDKYTRRSNAFTLIDGIMRGDYTMAQADAIGADPEKFLDAMLKIRARKNPLGEHSLESDLEVYSLKFIRVLNDMHNEPDAKRFASIEKFSAEELYTLMVYSEEEIFTSTFNGLFSRLQVKMGPVSGFDFLKTVGDNRFRTFIKMCAGFGKLRPFLQSMSAVYQQMLMIKFASGLEQYNDLSQAVEVADAFGSIQDSLVLKILRGAIKYEYIKLSTKGDARGKTVYGLLSGLFVERNVANNNWFSSISHQYAMPGFDHINNSKLFNSDSVSRWLIYFYDDEDGESSFSTFIKTFTTPEWAVVDSGIYVIIKSKTGKPVHIYANKPKNEYDGQAQLEKIFTEHDYEPNVMVHRGHSYYAMKTIEKVRDNTQIFVLGSCGGYHSISSIIDRSPEVSIISSKQIGTKFVNNPMLKLLAENVRDGKDIEWQPLWEELEKIVKNNPKAYDRFQDYIPPHKNLGAIFIKTYNKLVE